MAKEILEIGEMSGSLEEIVDSLEELNSTSKFSIANGTYILCNTDPKGLKLPESLQCTEKSNKDTTEGEKYIVQRYDYLKTLV